jgi:MFS family permease
MSERQALLDKPTTPLPKMQLFLLFFIRMTDPVAFNCIFPFVQEMLLDIGAVQDPEKVGYYAGVVSLGVWTCMGLTLTWQVESIFSLVQLFTIFHWGALSDRIGRKPVLIIVSLLERDAGLDWCAGLHRICCFGRRFRLQHHLLADVLGEMSKRSIQREYCYLESCHVSTARAHHGSSGWPHSGEITDETNEARAFSLFPICLNSGIIVASYIGGTFANTRGTAIGNAIPLFDKFPYAFPMVLSSLFPLISGITALFFLKETLPENLHEEREQASPEDKSLQSLMTRHITLIIFSFGILSLLGVGVGALLPLFCFTAVDHGGLGFDAKRIGSVISQRSVAVLVIQMVTFPWLQKRVGTTRLFKWLMSLWIPALLLLPLCNIFARMGNETLVWVSLYLFMVVGSLSGMAFSMFARLAPRFDTDIQFATCSWPTRQPHRRNY